MRIVGKKRIAEFMKKHASSCSSLESWTNYVSSASWESPADVKKDFASASFLSNNRIVFNVGGNKYRLVVMAVYVQRTLVVTWIGTHAEYDRLAL